MCLSTAGGPGPAGSLLQRPGAERGRGRGEPVVPAPRSPARLLRLPAVPHRLERLGNRTESAPLPGQDYRAR